MKFRCDNCGADSPLDRDSLVVLEGSELPHIKCKMCGRMSVFGGGQIFTGDHPPPRPTPQSTPTPMTPTPMTPLGPLPQESALPKRAGIIALAGLSVVSVLVAAGAMVVAVGASKKVSEMKWNKADVSALGDQEAEHEMHDHRQALVVLGSPGVAQVGVLPVFLSAPTTRREGDGFWVDGVIHNALAIGMNEVEIQFVDGTGKVKIGVTKVGTVEAGKTAPWKVFLPGLGLKDERFVSVYAVVEHHLALP